MRNSTFTHVEDGVKEGGLNANWRDSVTSQKQEKRPPSLGLLGTFVLLFTLLFGPNLFAQQAITDHIGVLKADFEDKHSFIAPPADYVPGGDRAATITVNYTGFTAASQTAFQYAVDIWASTITSPVAIVVNANYADLGDPNLLGSAGPATSYRDWGSEPIAGTWYPVALANSIDNSDINGADVELNANFNSTFNWYLGTDGLTGAGQHDFVTVVLHELCHGLGLVGGAGYDTGNDDGDVTPSDYPYIYARFVENGAGTAILDFDGNAQDVGDELTSDNLFWNGANGVAGNGGVRPKLFAPGTWDPGSSFSHLDEDTYVAGTPNSLMTPQLGSSEAIHSIGDIVQGMFVDMGWTFCVGEDTEDPVAVCNNLSIELNEFGHATISVDDVNNNSFDNCTIGSMSIDQDFFDCDDLGANTVTLSVTDLSGNVGTCTSTVTVNDAVQPIIDCPAGDMVLTLDLSGNCNAPTLPDYRGLANIDEACNYTVSQSPAPGSAVTGNDGDTFGVTLTVTDSSGNSDSCGFTVTIDDSAAPNIVCPGDQEISVLDNNCGQVDLLDYTAMAQVYDNCDPNVSVTQSPAAGLMASSPGSTITVTLTADDGNGNHSSCSFDVSVFDTTAPVLTNCPADPAVVNIFNDASCVSATTLVLPSYYDNCGVTSIFGVRSDNGGTVDAGSLTQDFPVGTTTVTWTALDAAGNETADVCVTTITVQDGVSPYASCNPMPVQVTLNTLGEFVMTAAQLDAGSYDNCDCGIVNMWVEPKPGYNDDVPEILNNTLTCAHVGFEVVYSLFVEDCSGNINECWSSVHVEDKFHPILECPGEVTIQCQWGPGDPSESDGMHPAIPNPGAVLPTIVPVDLGLDLSSFIVYDLANGITGYAQAMDNCGAEVWWSDVTTQSADESVCEHYTYDITRTWTAVDPSGNEAIPCDQTIHVIDDIDPIFDQLAGDFDRIFDCNDPNINYLREEALNQWPSATDVCAPVEFIDIALIVDEHTQMVPCITGNVSEQYIRTWRATDPCGNFTDYTQIITVTDFTGPTLVCPNDGNTIVLSADANCLADVALVATADDHCYDEVDVTWEFMYLGGALLDAGTGLDASQTALSPGTYGVNFVAVDRCGNMTSCMTTIIIEDTTPPVLDCTGLVDITEYVDAQCLAYTALPFPTYSDNCGNAIVQCEIVGVNGLVQEVANCPSGAAGGGFFTKGVYSVNFYLLDQNGTIIDQCSYALNILDNINPTIGDAMFPCLSNISLLTSSNQIGDCVAEYNWKHPAVADNCEVILYECTMTLPDGTVITSEAFSGGSASYAFPTGVTSISYTVTDCADLTASCGWTVTVEDDEAPVCDYCPVDETPEDLPDTSAEGFTGAYADGNWTEELNGGDGSIDITETTMTVVGNDNDFGDILTQATITCGVGGEYSFSWDYLTSDGDGPSFDPAYFVNGVQYQLTDDSGDVSQSGEITLDCASGDVIGFGIDATDGAFGSSTLTITDFVYSIGVAFSENWIEYPTDEFVCTATDIPGIAVQYHDNCAASATYTLSGATTAGPTVGDNAGVETFNKGVTHVQYDIVDDAGNHTYCDFDVEVYDDEDPQLMCPADIVIDTDGPVDPALVGVCSATNIANANLSLGTINALTAGQYADNCGVVLIEYTLTGATEVATTVGDNAGVETFLKGVTTVTYTVYDTADWDGVNSSTCSFTVTVEDNEAPVFTYCPSDISVETVTTDCNNVVSWIEPLISDVIDNCLVECGMNMAYGVDGVLLEISDPTVVANIDPVSHQVIAEFPEGTTTVTYSAMDEAGNIGYCVFTVTVEDNQAPTIAVPSNQNISVDLNCSDPTLPDFTGLAVINDNCGTLTVTQLPAPGTLLADIPGITPANGEVITVTLTVDDGNGQTDMGNVMLTIVDDVGPYITCIADQDVAMSTGNGGCNAMLADYTNDVDAGSLCGTINNVTVTQSPASGTIITAATLVTMTADDGNGNTTSCTFWATPVDDVAPVFAPCTDDSYDTTAAAGECDANVSVAVPSATDNCGAVTVWGERSDGLDLSAAYPVCVTTITWYAQDAAGNVTESTCHTTVTVTEDAMPTANCAGGMILGLNADGVALLSPQAFGGGSVDVCSDLDLVIAAEGGAYPVDADGNIVFDCNALSVPNVFDNPVPVNVELWVTDCSGNTSYCWNSILVEDKVAPVITCPDNLTIECDESTHPDNTNYATATDNSEPCYGIDITWSDVSTQGNDPAMCDYYTYTITRTWRATDESGNFSECVQTIEVEDSTAPTYAEAAGDLDASIDCNDPNFDLLESWALALEPTPSDNCSEPIMTMISDDTVNNEPCINGAAQTRTRVWEAVDACGNATLYTQTISILDSTAPAIVCPNDGNSIYASVDGNCEVTVTLGGSVEDCFLQGVSYMVLTMEGVLLEEGNGFISEFTFGPGAYIMGYEAIDWCGNHSECMTTIFISDETNPVLDCAGLGDVNLSNDSGNCSAQYAWAHPGATDNCVVSLEVAFSGDAYPLPTGGLVSPNAGTSATFGLGTTTVTYTATDGFGNTDTCSFTVTVSDDEDPIIGAAANPWFPCLDDMVGTTGENTIGDCAKEINWKNPAVDDNCEIASYNVEFSAGVPAPLVLPTGGAVNGGGSITASFNVGVTVVTYTVVDAAGNSTSCSWTVTITDDENPTVFCQDVTIELDEFGMASITPADIDNGSFDNCAIESMELDTYDFTCVDLGDNMVTLTVFDAAGNSAYCTATVTVEDNITPTIDCGAAERNRNSSDDEAGVDPLLTDCDYVAHDGEFDPATWDNCDYTYSNDYNGEASLDGAVFPVGSHLVTWTIVDEAGNSATCSNTIIITDDENPIFTYCPSDIDVSATTTDCNQVVSWIAPVMSDVHDNCEVATLSDVIISDPNVTVNIIIDGNGDPQVIAEFPVGTTEVKYTATDIHGNSTDCIFNVTVNDVVAPLILCPTDQIMNVDVNCNADETYVLDYTGSAQVADNCNDPVVTQVPAPGTLVSDVLGGDPVDGSSFVVTLTATDIGGNTDECSFNVTINDNAGPYIVCPGDQVAYTSTGDADCNAMLPDLTPLCQAGNNCDGDYTLTQSPAPGTMISVPTIVTMTASDNNGNSTSCSFIVTVEDDVAPVITSCPGDAVAAAAMDECTAMVFPGMATATDGCSPFTNVEGVRSDGAGLFDAYPAGVTTITWTASDIAGNTAECTSTVTVTETGLPIANCFNDVHVALDQNGEALVTAAQIDDNSFDYCCEIANTWIEFTDPTVVNNYVNCSHVGMTLEVTLYVEDCGGNIGWCTGSVFVEDNYAPIITHCPADQMAVENDFGFCGAQITLEALEAEDNCPLVYEYSTDGGATWTTGNNASGYYEVGVTTIMWVVTDPQGNTDTCETTIEVLDLEDPTADCVNTATTSSADGLGLYDCAYTVSGTEFDPATDDNCAVASVSNDWNGTSSLGGTALPVGTNIIVWTVVDIHGNSTTCTSTIEVSDDELPTVACVNADFTSSEDGLGLYDCGYTVDGAELDPAVDDNCGVASISNDFNGMATLANAVFPVGTTNVVWTVVDIHGNVNACTATINVSDDENPTIDCPGNQAVNTSDDDLGDCDYVASGGEFDADYSDNCAVVSITNDYNGASTLDGAAFETGSHTVTWTATDAAGNDSSCTFTITVTDDENPICIAADPITAGTDEDDNYDCGAYVTIPALEYSDNCGIMMVTHNSIFADAQGDNASGVYPNGTTTVTWFVLDVNGNMSMCSTTITIEDNEAPMISCPADVTVENDLGFCGADVAGLIATADDNCDIDRIDYAIEFADGTSTSGTSTGEADTHDVDASTYFPVGVSTITFTAYDIYGATASCTTTVTVNDTEDPTITCPTDIVVTTDAGVCEADVTVPQPAVADNCEVDYFTNDYTGTDNASAVYSEGTTTVVWTVVDIHGNSSTCTMTVTVNDEEDPAITCAADATRGTSEDGDDSDCQYTVQGGEFDLTAASDNCGIATITNDFNGAPTLDGANLQVGDTDVTWTVTDIHGNVSTCTTTITVEDDQNPYVECVGSMTRGTSTDGLGLYDCGYTVSGAEFDPITITDNCGIASVVNDWNGQATLDTAVLPAGLTIITWTITDVNGNVSTCEAYINVVDDEVPVASCTDIVISLDLDGSIEVTQEWIELAFNQESWDNCTAQGQLTYEVSQTVFTCADVGTMDLTLTVTDGEGNSNSCTSTLTVLDEIAPVAICQDLFVTTTLGSLEITPDQVDNGSYDECGGAITLVSVVPNTFSLPGEYPVTLTVMDEDGNIATCTSIVTVADGGIFYLDSDQDGFGDAEQMITAGQIPFGYSADGTDCDDTNSSVYPGAPGTAEDIDNNCDGVVFGPEKSCPCDLNNDGNIGSADLLQLLAGFTCVDDYCLGDFNADGTTNSGDLLFLLSSYGQSCP